MIRSIQVTLRGQAVQVLVWNESEVPTELVIPPEMAAVLSDDLARTVRVLRAKQGLEGYP